MSDPQVELVQRWLNDTYAGVSGWYLVQVSGVADPWTVYALIRALRHELGLSMSEDFDSRTLAALASLGPIGPGTEHAGIANINNIITGGLLCKNYGTGYLTLNGSYSQITMASVDRLATDVGVPDSDGTMFPKLLKALLTTSSYRLAPRGSSELRSAQRWLNRTYFHRTPYYFVQTDGVGSARVLTGLIQGVQFDIGLGDAAASGTFVWAAAGGATIRDGLAEHGLVSVGDDDTTANFVRLFTTGMLLNARNVAFSESFTATLQSAVKDFQEFSELTITGRADLRTWGSLLTAQGDPRRPGSATAVIRQLTEVSAAAMHAAGYRIVGRYLLNPNRYADSARPLRSGELDIIFGAGLRMFPIFQVPLATTRLSWDQGVIDGKAAARSAQDFDLPAHTTIYFSVIDGRATDATIVEHVVPYFSGVLAGLRSATSTPYQAGVYGYRLVCSTVSLALGLRHSHPLSTGPNTGVPLPINWAFDQIDSDRVSYAYGSILTVDRSVWYRSDADTHRGGIDHGVSATGQPVTINQPFFDWVTHLQAQAAVYRERHPSAASMRDLTIQYLRTAGGNYRGPDWDIVAGGDDDNWIAFVRNNLAASGREPVLQVEDPWTGQSITIDHMAYALQAVILHGLPTAPDPNRGDMGGWGGDLITVLKDYLDDDRGYPSARDFAAAVIGSTTHRSYFDLDDLLADIDGFNIAVAMRSDPELSVLDAMTTAYGPDEPGVARTRHRFTNFHTARFATATDLTTRGLRLFRYSQDAQFSAIRLRLAMPHPIGLIDNTIIDGLVAGFGDVLNRFLD